MADAEETFRIRGAIFEVHSTLGCGFLEAVYQESLALEFTARGIPFVGLRPLELRYKGHLLRQRYTPDFICFDKIILELKAVREFAPEHRAQLVHYLRATGMKVGLLANFGSLSAKVERVVLDPPIPRNPRNPRNPWFKSSALPPCDLEASPRPPPSPGGGGWRGVQ